MAEKITEAQVEDLARYFEEQNLQFHNRLVQVSPDRFLFRRIYSATWMVVSEDLITAEFERVFPGKQFSLIRAAIALDLYFQDKHKPEDIPARPVQKSA